MKNYAAITLLAATLVGCDNPSAPLSFTPEMASFSNEFDFDPLRGPVKDFTQTLFNDKGEVSKRVTGTMSTEGCFDTLELHDLEANTGVALVLDANYYLDAETQQRKV
ncbi:TPA: YnfC family lipoprotein, partial [Enterobacter ludwigii]|nr:YnfC family lipoprotein [Enterobacter ludwigii]